MNIKDEEIKNLLDRHKFMTVYGLSPEPTKPSHYVPVYMREKGWNLVGTYPKIHQVANFQIFQSLSEVPLQYRKFVDVFRSSDRIPDIVDEVLRVGGVEVLWLQLGISHPEAEKRAEAAGLKVVSNRCLIPEHKRWFGHD